MNSLYIISNNEQHRDQLLSLAEWDALGFSPVRRYEDIDQLPYRRINGEPMLLLWDTDEITEEDCKKISHLRKVNGILEIIVISDMRDYESLSRALDMHVAVLITWNEFQEDKFMSALHKELTNIDNQFHEGGIIKRQLLRDIMKGKMPTADEIYRFFNINDPSAAYVAFYIRRDEPVQLLKEFEVSSDYYAINWHGNPFHENLEYIATVNLYMHTWCTLLHIKNIPSTLNLYNLSWKTALMLQQSFATQVDDTVSIAFSDMFQGFDGFRERVESLQQILDLQNYNGRSRIASYRDPLPTYTDAQDFMNVWRPRISQSLYENDADAACTNVDKLFTQLRQDQYARSSCLEPVCRQLSEDIDNYCRNYSIPTVAEMEPDFVIDDPCYSLSDIVTVFKNIIHNVISLVQEGSIAAIDNNKIHDIIKYIENNCETASVSTVAEHFHMSVDYLSHFFKSKTGTNLSALITEKKVNKARSLLLQNKYKIKDVAAMVGFNSSQYFSTVFVKVVGMSPKQFIESQQK